MPSFACGVPSRGFKPRAQPFGQGRVEHGGVRPDLARVRQPLEFGTLGALDLARRAAVEDRSVPDESHARNAKARAEQQEEKGNLTAAEKEKIDRKADKILDK